MNERIEGLINLFMADEQCNVKPSSNPPIGLDPLKLPSDLEFFYSRCGSIVFFPNKDYTIEIVCPDDFVRANPVIVGEPCEYDISYNWFIIGKAGEQYITIDLANERLGRCYDSFWDRHGVPGENPIIAKSFTQLLEFIYTNKGEYWYWLQDNFAGLGDAYDEVA